MNSEEAQRYAKTMTYKDAIYNLLHAKSIPYRKATFIKIDELLRELEQKQKIDRLYRWLNDMRFGIAPDETTPQDERAERLAQVDVIDEIMEWLEKNEQEG